MSFPSRRLCAAEKKPVSWKYQSRCQGQLSRRPSGDTRPAAFAETSSISLQHSQARSHSPPVKTPRWPEPRFFYSNAGRRGGSTPACNARQARQERLLLLRFRCMELMGGGLENLTQTGFPARREKRGVPRHHGNMPPGNSFPQICVVSRNKIVENRVITQEYLGTMAESNLPMA